MLASKEIQFKFDQKNSDPHMIERVLGKSVGRVPSQMSICDAAAQSLFPHECAHSQFLRSFRHLLDLALPSP